MKSNFNLPKISANLTPSSYIHSDKEDVLFPRGQHPDTRSNAQWLKDMDMKIEPKKWYPSMGGRPGKEIICLKTGKRYKSIRDAAKSLKVDSTNLGKHLNGHSSYSHINGLKFERI